MKKSIDELLREAREKFPNIPLSRFEVSMEGQLILKEAPPKWKSRERKPIGYGR